MKEFRRVCLILTGTLLLFGCKDNQQVAGVYEIKTVAGETMILELTNEQNKRASFVPHDGSVLVQVQGAVPGVWRYTDDSKESILVYSLLSGSMFAAQYEVVLKPEGYALLDREGKPAGTIKRKK